MNTYPSGSATSTVSSPQSMRNHSTRKGGGSSSRVGVNDRMLRTLRRLSTSASTLVKGMSCLSQRYLWVWVMSTS